jgi:hypothetical protein
VGTPPREATKLRRRLDRKTTREKSVKSTVLTSANVSCAFLGLIPSEFDRSAEGVAAIVAQPVMVDTAAGDEAGFFSDQQGAAATRTFRPTGM